MSETRIDERKRLCAFDLDGTLLNVKKEISPKTVEAVEKLKEQGFAVTLITGRSYGQVEAYRRLLDIRLPVVMCNGAMIGEPGNWMEARPMDGDKVKWILQSADKEKRFVHLYGENKVFTQAIDGQVVGVYGSWHREEDTEDAGLQVVESLQDVPGPFYKLLIPFPSLKEREAWQKRLAGMPGIAVFSAGRALEIVAGDVSKGAGLKTLAESLGFEPEELIVFGDQANDESMFDYAGTGIAMGNAIESLKRRATYVTENHNEDGVAKAIDRWFLKRG